MRICLILAIGLCLGCEQATSPALKPSPSELDQPQTVADERQEPTAEEDEPNPNRDLPGDEIVPANNGLDRVATSIQEEPIFRYAAKCVVFSPDGRWLAIGTGNGRVALFNTATKTIERTWPAHNDWTFDLQFSADSQSLWTGGGDNRVRQWSIPEGEVLQRFEDHTDDVHGVALTSDGQWLVTGADDQLVVLRNLMTSDIRSLEGHTRQITSIALGDDDSLIASGSRDNMARIWDRETEQLRHELTGHTGHVMSVQFSHAGDRLLTGSNDHSARIWDVNTGELLHTFDRHEKAVFTAIWMTGDEVIATGSQDLHVRLIRVSNGETIAEEKLPSNVSDLALSPDGRTLAAATSGGNVQLFETDGESLIPSMLVVLDETTKQADAAPEQQEPSRSE